MVLLLLVSCSEYGLRGEPPVPGPPILSVTPSAVELTGVCGEGHTEVELANLGESVLEIVGVEVAGSQWQVDAPATPFTMEPGSVVPLGLSGAPSRSILTITSDDPASPVTDVPLDAFENVHPTATVTAPREDEIVAEDADLVLEGYVADTEDALDTLTGVWTSSLVGEVGRSTPDATGKVSFPWPADARAGGPQLIQLLVADSCGAVGETTLYYCQDGPWPLSIGTFDAWRTDGDATVDTTAGAVTLGPAVGAAWDLTTNFNLTDVDVQFEVRGAGAGFSLTALAFDGRDAYLGGAGGGLGC